MADTLNSWKQLFKVKENFESLERIDVAPQGNVTLSLNEAIQVAGDNVEVIDSDQVVVNASVLCPPIEFGIIMGEQDINRPGITNEDQGRVVFTTSANVAPRMTWGPAGSPTANLVNGNGVEGKVHELFISGPLTIGSEFEFIVGGTRAFCSDAASSEIYSFLLGVVTQVFLTATYGIVVETDILSIGASTTVTLDLDQVHAITSIKTGAEAGTERELGFGITTTTLSIGASTTTHLIAQTHMLAIPAITTVP